MKRLLLAIGIYISYLSQAQEVPNLSPKISDGVWLFPSLTGLSGGSAFVGHHRYAGNLQNTPIVHMAGLHTSFASDKMGLGVHLYQESVNVYKSWNASFQLAHHILLADKKNLSFGISTEYFRTELDRGKLETVDLADPIVKDFTATQKIDFSPSVSLSHPVYQIGFVVNRVRKVIENDKANYLTGFYTGFLHLYFKDQSARHSFEPTLIVRHDLSQKVFKNEAWLFYTYLEKYTLGATYLSNGRMGLALAYRWENRWVLGYNFDMQLGDHPSGIYGKYAHEIVLRFNFNKQYYRQSSFDPDKNPKKDVSNLKEF